ncbi:MAG: hypothetical protein M3Y82_10195, partial [Verrucomicrobiota bacterium]|nr:hypothetical protein [Verrucomicrobiota bacterium]
MRPVRSLSIYLLIIFLGGAWLAPGLYFLTQSAAHQFPVFEFLAKHPFPRFVNRSFLILALLGLWPFLRTLKVQQWSDVGFCSPRRHWKKSGVGFLFGFSSLAAVALLVVLSETRRINFDHST